MSGREPSPAQAVAAYRRLHLRLLSRGRLRLGLLALVLLPPTITALLLGWAKGVSLFDGVYDLELRLIFPLAAALALAGTFADEIDGRTFTYLHARPAPRWTLLAGRFLAVVPPLLAGFVAAVVLSYVLAMTRSFDDFGEFLPQLGRALAATALAVPCYGALSLALGTRFDRHPMLAVGAWVLVVEVAFGAAPGRVALLAMSWHLRRIADLPMASIPGLPAPQVPVAVSVLLLAAAAAGLLGLAGWFIERAQPLADR